MDLNMDTSSDNTNRRSSSDFGSAELEMDLMSRRESSQSDDGSIFAQLEANDTLFGDLADDVDDNLPSLMDTTRVSMEPIVSINPIRMPYEATSLLAANTHKSQSHLTSAAVTISAVQSIPSKRGPGRPRKDGKVPIQRKNLFPGRPRMRGRKTILGNVSGVPSSAGSPNEPTLNSFNISSALSIKPITTSSTPRMSSDAGRVELTISSGNFLSSQSSTSNVIISSDEYNTDKEAKISTKICAFCNLGDNSSLGLGELIQCEPSPGFSPFKRSARLRRSPDRDSCSAQSSGLSSPAHGKTI